MQVDARWLDSGIGQIDLNFQGFDAVIAAYVFDTADGLAVVDCGPTSTLDALFGGLDVLGLDAQRLRHVLLTHVHLDHAGGAGDLLQRLPDARVYVHEIGAPHVLDPAKLWNSAARIYGERMDALWGPMSPVPAERLTALQDGDTLDIGGRAFEALYTPGHAIHHIAYADTGANVIFCGDVAGVRIPPADAVWPPAPPPDVDVPAWHASIARLRQRQPAILYITHFGAVTRVAPHLDELDAHLDEWVAFVQASQAAGLDRDAIVARLTDDAQAQLTARGCDARTLARFATATPYGMTVDGILRYLRKREREATT
jgi:glyoxylase-like metal-dependent hydrolase (beta-lactamase superfamily II)